MKSIIDKLNQAGLHAVFAGNTNGGEYKAACPFCRNQNGDGGKDRFCVWPAEGRAWCRRCNWSGSLAEVLAALSGIDAAKAERVLAAAAPEKPRRRMHGDVVDPDVWQKEVNNLIRARAKALFTEDCRAHLEYLRSRGLTDDTIRENQLGGCFENRFYERERFGLKPVLDKETGNPKPICVPEGILIPYFDAEGICRKVQIRCDDARFGRYRLLQGSKTACLVLRPQGDIRAAVLVESALDAILCHQEVPEQFAFVALGSTAYRPDATTQDFLQDVPHIFIATDSDQAGKEAYYSLREDYPRASRLIVPPELGKDAGEAFLEGMDLRDWCKTGLELAERIGDDSTSAEIEAGDTGIDLPYKLIASNKGARAALDKLQAAEFIAVDIETAPVPEFKDDPAAGLDPLRSRARLIQATDGAATYIFDLDKVSLETLAPMFQSAWGAHNAVFDYKHLLLSNLTPEPVSPFCTMLCDNALTNQNRSLADLFQVHFGIVLDKSLQDSDWSGGDLSEAQLQYAARDAVAVLRLWEKLRYELMYRGQKKLAQLLHDAQQAVALMELNGIGFDAQRHAKAVSSWEKKRRSALSALRGLADGDLNPNSPAQLAAFLESYLDEKTLRDWPRTETGQLTTAAKEIAAFRGIPAVDALLDYRHWSDLAGKFGEKLSAHINPVTDRIHPRFHLAAARTGRMSASDPNVQGLPHDTAFRRLFIPPPGSVLVRADYNQMQLRVAALLSGDARLLNAYERGLDVHRLTAACVLGKKSGDVTPEERSLAKAIAFGILFGIGPESLRGYALNNYGVCISAAEAAQVRDRFFETYPDVRRWQREQVDEAQRTGCSVTPMGRVRNFTRENKDNFHTAAMNTPIQGGEGEVMLAALGLLPDALDPHDGLLVNCVHDEILVECPEASADAVEATLCDCMERGMRYVFPDATLNGLVEVGHGPNWAEAK